MLAVDDAADLDDGPRAGKPGTARMCALTRQVRPIGELIRFVVAPAGEVIPDLKRKLPGRGLWISASRKCVTEAVRRGLFGRGFKRDVRVSPDLALETERLLAQSATDALAITAKAGQAVSGFSKVERTLVERQAVALIHASDGAADGIRKLDAVARQNAGISETPREFPVINVLTADELDLALGRSNVIHAALLEGAAARTAVLRCQTLARFRMTDESHAGGTIGKQDQTKRDRAQSVQT